MTSRKRDVWQCPEYFNEFGKEEKIRCKEKLTLTDGTKITDPYGLSNNWKNDVSLLPDISWADMYNYLINTLNAYTDENSKAYIHLKFLISLYAIMFKMCSVILFQKNRSFAVSKQVKLKLCDLKNAYE